MADKGIFKSLLHWCAKKFVKKTATGKVQTKLMPYSWLVVDSLLDDAMEFVEQQMHATLKLERVVENCNCFRVYFEDKGEPKRNP